MEKLYIKRFPLAFENDIIVFDTDKETEALKKSENAHLN